jgi:phage head maturation protease
MVKVSLRFGSFKSVSAANALTSSTLAQHSETVDLVASGHIKRKAVESWFRAPTGKEAFANQLHQSGGIRPTFGVRAIIQHDPKAALGFRVVTSFPINP